MNTYIQEYKHFGVCLFAENGDVKIGIPLNFGLRICYLSYKGSENLFFEQPKDMTDITTPEGWRIYGGHRLWLAPESSVIYYPDNDPITYELKDDKIILSQETDKWLNVNKVFEITLGSKTVKIKHKVINLNDKPIKYSLWPITSLDAGGVETIPLPTIKDDFKSSYRLTTWYHSDLSDERIEFNKKYIKLQHKPLSKCLKIGIGHPGANVTYVNKGVVFEKSYKIFDKKNYADGNVSFETYLCEHMVEVETLSPLYTIKPNKTAVHTERWILSKNKK